MQWVEIVVLKTCDAAFAEDFISSKAAPHLAAVQALPNCLHLAVLRQPSLVGTVALLAVWSGSGRPTKSREMLAIADHLASFGLIDHEVWAESRIPQKPTTRELAVGKGWSDVEGRFDKEGQVPVSHGGLESFPGWCAAGESRRRPPDVEHESRDKNEALGSTRAHIAR